MPYLQSLSIRLRGSRTTDKSNKSTSSTATSTAHSNGIKHLFSHRDRKSDTNSKHDKQRSSTDKMGNAPSDMNTQPGGPRGQRLAQLARAATDNESVRSRAMPGAEPPTPTPLPEPSLAPAERPSPPTPKPEERPEVNDVQAVAHVENPTVAVEEKSDAEGEVIPSVGSFEVEQPGAEETEGSLDSQAFEQSPLAPLQIPAVEDAAAAEVDPDSVKTPRAAAKPEEFPALTTEAEEEHHEHVSSPNLENQSAHHASEGSEATAVSAPSRSGTPPASLWTPGTYVLLNARSGTAVDMSGMDDKTLIGYPMHGGPNQQWEFIPSGHGYVIRCVRRSKAGHPLYLTTEDGLRENAAIVASPYPVSWNVEQTDDGIRISWPNTDFVFDLAECGSNTPGTKVQLMRLKPGESCQLWHYTRCARAEHDAKDVDVRSARAVSPPATTETVSVTEEREHITTTRTTTTTTITTVTEVTRMPRWMLAHARPATATAHSPNRRSIGYRLA